MTPVQALVIIVSITVAGLVALNVLVPGDHSALTKDILSIAVPSTVGLMTWLNSAKNSEKIADVKAKVATVETKQDTLAAVAVETKAEVAQVKEQLAVSNTEMDGHLTALIEESVKAARLLGHDEGEQAERDRREH